MELVEGGQLGRYTLVRRIGKGGMGEVWLAKALGAHGFEKSVALKRILPQYSSNPHVVNMLVDEARISVLLNHPNVVQVLELGEDDGDYFIAMEYVEGHAFSRLLRRLRKASTRLDVLEACYVTIQILEGLHAAHVQKDQRGKPAGIIHRDVSPQNVIVSHDGLVKVIDFGIARARERLEVTQGASVKGKLRYMAPEQLSPKMLKGAAIDHRVDVFAAGLVLFEALSGRQRFGGDDEADIMAAILKEPTPDLVREGLVDRELMTVLEQALAKDRDQRFKDAATFAAQLRGYLYKRDPSFTADRLAARMRSAFAGEGAGQGKAERDRTAIDDPRDSASVPLHGDGADDEDATRTAFRRPKPRVSKSRGASLAPVSDSQLTRSQRRNQQRVRAIAAGVIAGALVLAGVLLVVQPRIKRSAPAVSDTSTAASAAASPVAARPTTPPVVVPVPAGEPARVSDGWSTLSLVAEPATTRISLADQPDPKYVSPARLRARVGDELLLVFEADGFETQRHKLVVPAGEPPEPALKVVLQALPVDLVIKVYPRDAVVSVDGKPARSGLKVFPGVPVEVRAEHPFSRPKVIQGVPRPGEPYVVELRLDEVDSSLKGQRLPRGALVIHSKPPGAQVFVDGQRVGGVTPMSESVLAGPHRVTVRGPKGEQTFMVDVADGATVKRDVFLE